MHSQHGQLSEIEPLAILLVDDEPIIREGLRSTLARKPKLWDPVRAAQNGREALEILEKEPVDCVITDVKMPILDGIELLTALRQRNSALPVVIITGYPEFNIAQQALHHGAVDLLLKPVSITEIEKVLLKIRERKVRPVADLNHPDSGKLEQLMYKEVLRSVMYGHNPAQFKQNLPMLVQAPFLVFWVKLDENSCNRFMKISDFSLIIYALTNMIEELLKGCGDVQPVEDGITSVVTVFHPNSSDLTEGYLQKINQLEYLAESCLNVKIKVRPSGLYQSMSSLSEAYAECTGQVAAILNGPDEVYDNSAVQLAVQFIHQHYMEDLSLQLVANKVFLNPNYFSNIFKKMVGMNFIEYLTKTRMEKAKQLLQNPEFKIHQVAEQVGYTTSRYFSQVFKQYYGELPSECRERLIR